MPEDPLTDLETALAEAIHRARNDLHAAIVMLWLQANATADPAVRAAAVSPLRSRPASPQHDHHLDHVDVAGGQAVGKIIPHAGEPKAPLRDYPLYGMWIAP